MEAKLVALGVETFKIALLLALPGLLTGMFLGLAVSIFQATTQINEMTLSFIPKILGVNFCNHSRMPLKFKSKIDFATNTFNMIPNFIH